MAPEVKHSPLGQKLIENFLHRCAALPNDWDASIIEDQVKKIREKVGNGKVSAACPAALTPPSPPLSSQGHRRPAHLRLRRPRPDAQERRRRGQGRFVANRHPPSSPSSADDHFLGKLAGVSEPERKRKIIGEKFIRIFEKAARPRRSGAARTSSRPGHLDRRHRIRRGRRRGQHQEPPQRWRPARLHQVRDHRTAAPLFKDEVAPSALSSVCPTKSSGVSPSRARVWASASSATITKERLDLLREADAIAREELSKAGLDRDIWQCPVVLLADVHSVGVQGDERTYGSPTPCARSARKTP